MAWPTTGSGSVSSGYLSQGVTTIRWGSADLLKSWTPAGGSVVPSTGTVAVVTRFSQRQLVDNIKLPQGVGLTSTRVMIVDGAQWDLTVRDNTGWVASQANMSVGDTVVIVDAAGMIFGSGTDGVGQVYTATIVDNGYEAAPKQPGERTLVVENLVLVESQAAASQ